MEIVFILLLPILNLSPNMVNNLFMYKISTEYTFLKSRKRRSEISCHFLLESIQWHWQYVVALACWWIVLCEQVLIN